MTEDCKNLKMLTQEKFEQFKNASSDYRNEMEYKKALMRERSNAFDTVNMSMTSQHSYFYQADAAGDITDSVIEQTSIDNIEVAQTNQKSGREGGKVSSSNKVSHSERLSNVSRTGVTNQKARNKVKLLMSSARVEKQDSIQVAEKEDKLFRDFDFCSREVPRRDQLILQEIEDHRRAVQTQIELKRHSYHK